MKRSRFCPGCGKTINEKQEFCTDCRPIDELEFKDILFNYCSSCKSYESKNKWKKVEDENEAVIKVVKEKIKKDIKKVIPKVPDVTIAPGVNVDFEVEAEYDSVEYSIPGRFLVTICPKCSKQDTTYFEGILQIRNPNDKVVAFVKQELERVKDRGIYASNVADVKGGLDFYFTNKKFMRKVGRELKKRFDGDHNEAAQHFSYDHLRSRNIYRLNVLFRCK